MIYSVKEGRKSERLREREIDRERERLGWMEDDGGQIEWVWGWSGDQNKKNRPLPQTEHQL